MYSHILDDDRKTNAQLFEDAFYGGQGMEPAEESDQEEKAAESTPESGSEESQLLMKILANPEAAALLKALAKTL